MSENDLLGNGEPMFTPVRVGRAGEDVALQSEEPDMTSVGEVDRVLNMQLARMAHNPVYEWMMGALSGAAVGLVLRLGGEAVFNLPSFIPYPMNDPVSLFVSCPEPV